MNPVTIVALINGAAQIAKAVAPLIAQGQTVLSSQDEAQIKAALADLQAANEAIFDRVQGKLRGSTA